MKKEEIYQSYIAGSEIEDVLVEERFKVMSLICSKPLTYRNFKDKLIDIDRVGVADEIKERLKGLYLPGNRYKVTAVKSKLGEIFKEYGIKLKPTAAMIINVLGGRYTWTKDVNRKSELYILINL